MKRLFKKLGKKTISQQKTALTAALVNLERINYV